jgi:hypothetical protein
MHAEPIPSPELLALIEAKGLSTVIEMVASYCSAEATKTNIAAQAHLADADRIRKAIIDCGTQTRLRIRAGHAPAARRGQRMQKAQTLEGRYE